MDAPKNQDSVKAILANTQNFLKNSIDTRFG
jgi:hypothetical protein